MSRKKDKGKILFFRESVFKVAEMIFNKPNTVFHIRGLANETGVSTTGVISAIEELQKYDLITVEKTAITTNIRANLESEAYRFYKKIFNLYRIERSLLVQALKDTYRAKAIVLFGSFARGEDIEESDIDILILTNHKKEIDLTVYEKKLNRSINLQILKSLEKSSSEFKNAMANGIVLQGYLKVV